MKAKIKITAAMFIFGSIGLFVRAIDMPSALLALIRGSAGSAFLLLAGLVTKRRISAAAVKRNLGLLLFSGAAIAVNWICLFESYRYTTIATATLCYYLAPVFVMLASPILLKERLTVRHVVCIAAALAGMVSVADVGTFQAALAGQGKGILFGLLAAGFYAAVVLSNKFLKNIKATDMTAIQLGTAAAVLLPYVLLTQKMPQSAISPHTVLLLLFVGIVNTGIAYLLYFSSLLELSAQSAAIFSYIDPVTAILLSAVLLGEKMTAAQTGGAVLILGSALVSGMGKKTASGQI